MDLCKYKDALGVPGEGIHSYRLFNIAIVDVVLTILAGILVSYMFHLPAVIVTTVLFLLGIVLHHVFCVKTTVDKLLFP